MTRSCGASGPARLVAPVVLAVLGLTGCGSDTPEIVTVRGDPASATLAVSVDTCNAHPHAEVQESAGEVRLVLRAQRTWGRAECADSVVVTLDSVLGDRTVVDGSSDRTLDVLPLDG